MEILMFSSLQESVDSLVTMYLGIQNCDYKQKNKECVSDCRIAHEYMVPYGLLVVLTLTDDHCFEEMFGQGCHNLLFHICPLMLLHQLVWLVSNQLPIFFR